MTYSIVCDQDHAPQTITVQADSDDQALELVLAQEKAHVAGQHPNMPPMTDDEAREYIKSHWTKS